MTKNEQLELMKRIAELETRVTILEKRAGDADKNGVKELKVGDVVDMLGGWLGNKK